MQIEKHNPMILNPIINDSFVGVECLMLSKANKRTNRLCKNYLLFFYRSTLARTLPVFWG